MLKSASPFARIMQIALFFSKKMLLHMMAVTGQSVSSFTQGKFLEMLPADLDLGIWPEPQGPWQSCQAVHLCHFLRTSSD